MVQHIRQSSSPSSHSSRQIQSCLLIAGPDLASHDIFFRDLSDSLESDCNSILVPVSASGSPNLKVLFKHIVASVVSNQAADAGDEFVSLKSKGRRMLNYDLQIIQDWLKGRNIEKIVIALEDSEAFDSSLIGDIVEILRCVDRVPKG